MSYLKFNNNNVNVIIYKLDILTINFRAHSADYMILC